ncbi:uracil-DNA glycosylase [Thalassoglobus sp.]|uniref:uracil-DNA glycosylase n=1 Tax=Thalassoglobus sp. TaxID=2795869 RepID=UPI003AA7DA96
MNNPQRAALQLLKDCQSAGLTHLPLPVPLDEQAESVQAATEQSPVVQEPVVQENVAPAEVAVAQEAAPLPDLEVASVEQDRESLLTELAARVANCTRCQELASTRTQTVFGVGNPEAKVMFIGEAPGADEDRQGEPFVGKAGQLLTKIIGACGWTREELYICNILRCRPPGNRNPTSEEANNCREYLDGQISIVDPDYIVCWGGVAVNNLLGVESPVGQMRGKFHQHGRAKVLCTYHPSYLLRNPSAKKPVWEDMQFLLADMGLKPPQG